VQGAGRDRESAVDRNQLIVLLVSIRDGAPHLTLMEKSREAYWRKYQSTTPIKLRWRAVTVRHCLHVLAGETILDLGAGSGLWTVQLSEVLSGKNPIVGAVFNSDFLEQANEKKNYERKIYPD